MNEWWGIIFTKIVNFKYEIFLNIPIKAWNWDFSGIFLQFFCVKMEKVFGNKKKYLLTSGLFVQDVVFLARKKILSVRKWVIPNVGTTPLKEHTINYAVYLLYVSKFGISALPIRLRKAAHLEMIFQCYEISR